MKYSRWWKVTVGVWVISCALSYGHEFIAYMNDSGVNTTRGPIFPVRQTHRKQKYVCVGQSYGI